jgi:hypothetical protein
VRVENLARHATGTVQLVERDDLLVGGNLEDGIAAGVNDEVAGADVLVAELLEDGRPRGRPVAEDPAAGAAPERVEDLGREALGKEGERFVDAQPGDLPVAGRCVLARRGPW